MKTYVINLERRPDRFERMQTECANAGVEFERITAVDGQDPDVVDAARSCDVWCKGEPIHPNEYAAFQSHRKCWQLLVQSGDEYAAILEDDVFLSPEGAAFFSDSSIPEGVDIVKLETFGVRVHVSKNNAIRVGDRLLRRLKSRHLGTGGYILSRRAASYLLERSESVRQPVDWFIFDPRSVALGRFSVYQLMPAVVVQGKRQSTGNAGAAWATTSIPKSFAGEGVGSAAPRRFVGRVLERGKEEARSLGMRTKYIVVPYR